MNDRENELQDELKKVADEGLLEKDLETVSGGFNPQPDPPRGG